MRRDDRAHKDSESSAAYTQTQGKNHRGGEWHENMQTREREEKAESPGGEWSGSKHLDEAMTARIDAEYKREGGDAAYEVKKTNTGEKQV